MTYQRLWWCLTIPFLCVAAAYAAETPARPGTRAVLEIEYLIDAQNKHGNVMKDTREREWRVKRVVKSQVVLEAQPLQRGGVSDPSVGQQIEVQSKDIGAKGEAMQAEHGDTLETLEKEIEKCGEDEACMARVAQKMVANPEMGAILGKTSAMMEQSNQMLAAAPPRFQSWVPVAGTKGDIEPSTYEYSADEWSKTLTYDPICGKTGNICTDTRQRKGSGKTTMPLFASVEIDTTKNLISLDLGLPIQQLPMSEETTSTENGPRNDEITRQFVNSASDLPKDSLKLIGLPLKGSFRSQSGEKVVVLKNGVDDYPGPIQLTARWRFTVQN